MTTIVLHNNEMASDSQATSSYVEYGFKKIYETPIAVYGFAGDPFNIEIFVKALDALHTGVPFEDEDGDILVEKPDIVTVDSSHSDEDPSSCVFFIKETGETGIGKIDSRGCVRRLLMNQPIVIGSGCDFAMTAINLGCDAEAAVEAAIKLDPYSGGEVSVVKCKIGKVS